LTYVPTIKDVKITKSTKNIRGRSYVQYTITIPKEFGEKTENEGIKNIIMTADDMLFGVPPDVLLEKDEEELVEEIRVLVSWLKRHVRRIGGGSDE